MSRRTFPRAVAAGLLAAALGGPAAGQAPNPWRGERAALPTAPAPRAVAPKPTRQLIIGLGINSTSGLTGTIEIRELAPPTPAPVKTPRILKIESTAPRTLPTGWFVQTLPTPRYLEHYPTYFPPAPAHPMPRELPTMTYPDGTVVRASYASAPAYMPPPPPLPVPAIPPAAP
jgi:hypothetical protein